MKKNGINGANAGRSAPFLWAKPHKNGAKLVLPHASCRLWLPHWRKSTVRWTASIHAKYGKKLQKKKAQNWP